ncbi:MAG: YhfC family intramembrane metalloprotease [Oscillospiraceae bacterium]|nr:YhfC family intramembrane metalloprotease [Oscillospiraceae bacterium]
MENELFFSAGTLAGYALNGTVYLLVPIAVAFLLYRYRAFRLIPLLTGIAVYFLSVRFCDVFTGIVFNRQALAVQTAMAAGFVGIFEESGRYFAAKCPIFGIRSDAAACSYAVGHAGLECMIRCGQNYHIFDIGRRLNANGIGSFLVDRTAERTVEITETLNRYAEHSLALGILDSLSVITNFGVHLALTILIYRKLYEGIHPVRWMGIACLLHFSLNDCYLSTGVLGGEMFASLMSIFWGIGIIVLVWKIVNGNTVLDNIRYQMADSDGYPVESTEGRDG